MNVKTAVIVVSMFLFAAANAVAIPITSVSLTYPSSLSGGVTETFTFLGAGLDISGSSGNLLEAIGAGSFGSSFSIGLPVISTDAPPVQASGILGGTTYSDLALNSATLVQAGGLVLTGATLNLTLPETVSGAVSACEPYTSCTSGGGTTVSLDIALQGILSINATPVAPGSNNFYISSATFTTAPEPGTIWISVAGFTILLLAGVLEPKKSAPQT